MTSNAKRVAWVVGAAILSLLSVHHFGQGVIGAARYGFVDFPIFLERTATFLETGQLYLEASRLVDYAPAAPVYKFPPLFAMTLMPFAQVEPAQTVYDYYWLFQILLYLASVTVGLSFIATGDRLRFVVVGAIVALNLEPFFETLWRLQLETPILLLLTLCLFCLVRGRDEIAGALLGVAVMFKLYPAFLLIYLLAARRFRAVLWTLATAVAIQVATLIVVGSQENYRFVVEVLPLLLGETPRAISENVGIGGYAMALLEVDGAMAKRIAQLGAFLLLAASVYAVEFDRRRPEGERDTALGFVLFIPVMLLVTPNSWANYQVLLLLPALILLARSVSSPLFWRLSAPTILGLALLLFYVPCAEASVGWPCSRTPAFLGIAPLPRPLHDAMVGLRGLSSLLLWGVACYTMLARNARRGATAEHR